MAGEIGQLQEGKSRSSFRRTRGRAFTRPFSLGRRADRSDELVIPEGYTARSKDRDTLYRRLLALADVGSAAAAIVLAVTVLGNDSLNLAALLAIPLVLVASKVSGLYDRDEHLLRKNTVDEIPTLFSVTTLYTFLIWLAGDAIVVGEFGRVQAMGVWGLLFALMFTTRVTARFLANRWVESERCLVLGDQGSAEWVRNKLAMSHGVNAIVVDQVPVHARHVHSIASGEGSARLERTILEGRIDRVIIAPDGTFTPSTLDAIRQVKAMGVKVSLLPRLFEVVGSSVELDEIDGLTLLGVRRYGLTRSSAMIKRTMDIAVSLTAVTLVAPLMLMIALAVKLDSTGPVFFRQRRMGQGDEPFEMLKFRTMVVNAESRKAALRERNEAGGGLFKIGDDPRITRIGKFLRRTSLDELPQLLNVLRGDMSLVGPRPLVIDEDSQIEKGWQRRRLQLPPGMTGMWQVFGSARIPMDEMVKIDYRYGANWSLWLDMKILLRTIPVVIGRRGL